MSCLERESELMATSNPRMTRAVSLPTPQPPRLLLPSPLPLPWTQLRWTKLTTLARSGRCARTPPRAPLPRSRPPLLPPESQAPQQGPRSRSASTASQIPPPMVLPSWVFTPSSLATWRHGWRSLKRGSRPPKRHLGKL